MRFAAHAVVATVVAAAAFAVAPALSALGESAPTLGPGPVTVVVDIEHSSFEPADLRVARGTTVRFVVVNHDPINHELIVGPDSVHERHRDGTEAEHGDVPGEVSVGPLERAVTSYTFDEVGTIQMACHLPGHYAYGMRAEVTVVR